MIILMISLISFACHATSIGITGGTVSIEQFEKGTEYQMYLHHPLGNQNDLQIGINMAQANRNGNSITQITLPNIGIVKSFSIKETPFKALLGAGFGWAHLSPHNHGEQFLNTFFKVGLTYRLSPFTELIGEYNAGFGNTLVNNNKTIFDSQSIRIGCQIRLLKSRQEKKVATPPLQKQSRPPQTNQQRSNPSTYQKTQQLMNNLSWPTY